MLPRQLICASLFSTRRPIAEHRDCRAAQGETDVRACRLVTTQCGTAYAARWRRRRSARRGQRVPLSPGSSTSPAPFTASRLPCTRSSRPIRVSRSGLLRQDSRRRSRSSATAMTWSWVVNPFAVSEIEWVRPSCRSARMLTSPRSSIAGQRPADRSLVETDHMADARRRNFRLDREQRQDPPFRDVDAKALLIDHGRAARQFVGDEGDERRNVAVEVEHLFGASAPACRARAGRARLSVPAHALPKPLQHPRHRDRAHRSARTICRRPT